MEDSRHDTTSDVSVVLYKLLKHRTLIHKLMNGHAMCLF